MGGWGGLGLQGFTFAEVNRWQERALAAPCKVGSRPPHRMYRCFLSSFFGGTAATPHVPLLFVIFFGGYRCLHHTGDFLPTLLFSPPTLLSHHLVATRPLVIAFLLVALVQSMTQPVPRSVPPPPPPPRPPLYDSSMHACRGAVGVELHLPRAQQPPRFGPEDRQAPETSATTTREGDARGKELVEDGILRGQGGLPTVHHV